MYLTLSSDCLNMSHGISGRCYLIPDLLVQCSSIVKQTVNKRIAEALSENRSRDFWGEIKRIRQKRAASSSSVDGFSNSSDIADSFADKFHELYTTVDYDKDELLDICTDLNVSLHDVDSNPLLSVTPTDVLCAIRRLKSGKFDGDS